MKAIQLAQAIGALRYIAPDLERGMGVEQNQAHSYDVWEHNLRSLQHAADKDWPFDIRLSALFHDVSKPETRRRSEEKRDWTFYGHDVVGARVTKKALQDLRFPKETVDKVSGLVRWHMFFSDPEKVTLSAVRRIIRNVGQENIWDLVHLRICDRIGTGRPKEQPFRLRKYQSMIEEALQKVGHQTDAPIDRHQHQGEGRPAGIIGIGDPRAEFGGQHQVDMGRSQHSPHYPGQYCQFLKQPPVVAPQGDENKEDQNPQV